jgi:hypothetical protein
VGAPAATAAGSAPRTPTSLVFIGASACAGGGAEGAAREVLRCAGVLPGARADTPPPPPPSPPPPPPPPPPGHDTSTPRRPADALPDFTPLQLKEAALLQDRTLSARGELLRRLAPTLLPPAVAAVRAHWDATGGAEAALMPHGEVTEEGGAVGDAPAAARAPPLQLLHGALLAAVGGGGASPE